MIADTGSRALLDAIFKLTGMQIEDEKLYLLQTRLSELMQNRNLVDYAEVAKIINQGKDFHFIESVIDNIATHETLFMRDAYIFEAFVKQMIPEWLERQGINPAMPQDVKLKIWSAGCSTGQEAYSIMMLLKEHFSFLMTNLKIVATDISLATLEKAKSGFFTDFEISRGLPESLRNKYFIKVDQGYKIEESLIQRIDFQKQNLISDLFPNNFDIIFCRNTLIYFPLKERIGVLEKLRKSLKKDGMLILGSAESLSGLMTNYILRKYKKTHYYELNSSQVTLF